MLGNCGGRYSSKNQSHINEWLQQEAKFFDVPVLINAKPESVNNLNEFASSEVTQLVYTVRVSYADAISFYEQEMERSGWNMFSSIVSHETLLIFEKPSKICSISIRPLRNIHEVKVVIFLKGKE